MRIPARRARFEPKSQSCWRVIRGGGPLRRRQHAADPKTFKLSRLSRSRSALAGGRIRAPIPRTDWRNSTSTSCPKSCRARRLDDGRRLAATGSRAGRNEHSGAPRSGVPATSIFTITRRPTRALKRWLAAAPDDYPSQFGLGIADKHLGPARRGRAHFEAACQLAPRAAQCRRELDALK